MNTTQLFQTIEAALATKTTDELLLMSEIIEGQATTTEDERMIKAEIAEVIVKRHGIAANIDAILDADETFEVTYGQAMRIALAEVAA